MTTAPLIELTTPVAPKYQRTVISTSRNKPAEPVPADLVLARADVLALSKALKDTDWYARQRLAALKTYQGLPMPTLNDDAWRRTDIRTFKWDQVQPPMPAAKAGKPVPAALLKPLVGRERGGLLVVADGRTVETTLDASLRRSQVVLVDFRTAARKHEALLKKYLGKTVPVSDGKFAALAATLADTGLLVYVPKGVKLDLPLHSVAWLTGPAHFSRVVIVVDDGAAATVVHETASPQAAGAAQALHAGTVEVVVGKGAHLTFVELQSLGTQGWNFTHERVRIARGGTMDWIFSAVGSHLTKNFSEIDLDGAGATGKMSGFYFANGDQHLDHDTQQNHNAPHTTSDLLFKGALRDKSRSVWQGMIYVAPGAQKADGYQANRNLVLSRGARADSIPGLEILADDVRCTHGATVGQLDEEQIFYLMSRGMPRAEAQKVVVDGFFDPVLQRIPFEGVRDRLKRAIEAKMG